MPSAKAHIPSAAFRSTTSSLVGPPPPHFIFKSSKHHHIPLVPCPVDSARTPPTGLTHFPSPIAFGLPGHWKQGIPFKNFDKAKEGMEGKDSVVCGELGIHNIILCFTFPSYDHVEWKEHLSVGTMTKVQLAHRLVEQYKLWMKAAREARHGQWLDRVIGENTFWDDLILLELCHFDGDYWQLNVGYIEK
ncbi:hypothetical protein FA13DRAFT_1790992 [Coprinellus micaceus]|uniref:Uncharacterized protein n=1 Tax=Coprinellus micaceus TaxID=71717 RepID=A0A4Y7TF54_COPMI|nr:hypothetical protein FA13DRAFT_1790992 [Coprinellus micaceus]